MSNALTSALRSVEIALPDVAAAEKFYVDTWGLSVAARHGSAVYLRGSGADHHLLALHEGATPHLRALTFRAASADALDAIAGCAATLGGEVLRARAPVTEPGGGESVVVRDPQGRVLRYVHGDIRHADAREVRDRPLRLAHVVMNSREVAAAQPFYEGLGFRLADRTRMMAFMRIPMRPKGDHHSIALADADNNCLNHIAFYMPDLDSVMRGGGRLKDAGFPIEWGPGRHGPGDNAFNYFIGPAGFVIEYTGEVEQVDDSYEVGMPDDWKWPPGRIDHWGISAPPSARLKQAQREIGFTSTFARDGA